jgi:hypothetical protein
MSTWLMAAGALPFILLGALHFRMTVVDLKAPQKFAPAKPGLLEELQNTRMNFRKDLKNFWLTYLGFHFSHSIGLMFYGAVVMYCALVRPDIFGDMTVRLAIVIVGASYVFMARMFWFIIPLIGSLVGVSLIAIGMAMRF